MQTKIKKMLAVILSLLMVMTMLPMTVIPSSAAEYVGHHNIKVEVVDWVVRDAGQIVGEFNAVEHGDAFYYESLTEADDGTFTFSYTLALERNGGNTAWDENSISFKIDSCEEEFLQEFEKSFVSSYYIEYNIKVSRRAGHSFSDWADVGDGTHTRICSFCGTVETKAHSFSGANCTTKGKCVCGLESTKDSNNHAKPVKHVVNSENEFKHDEVYECCGVINSNLDHKYDSNGMCKECKYQCEHTVYTNGICDVCRYKCSHTAIVDGECTLCGKVGILYINRYWDEETKSVVEVTEIAPVETIEVDGSFSTLKDGCWYVVRDDITTENGLKVSGTAHLILADGATLTNYNGLVVNEGNTLYIYAQSSSDDCGKLVSTSGTRDSDRAGIGGGDYSNCGTVVINGGNIQAKANGRGTGIGGGFDANGGNITINGGIVTATPSSSYNAAIGGSNSGSGGNITINGGTVIANGVIGSYSGNSGNITINGGNVTSGGIGSRTDSSGNITINGGNVTSSGSIGGKKVNSIVVNGGVISVISTGEDNAAIGGGYQGSSGSININGGVITATGGAAAIGGGKRGYVDSITITGGTVIATRSDQTAGYVGSSYDSNNCTVVLSGGNIKASQVRGVSVTDGNGNDVALNTITLSGASADTAVTKVEGIAYGLDDVKTLDTDKLYFYLPADSALSAITAGENEYICNRNLTYHTSHDWSDANGICTGCGDKCDHAEQTGEICGICGGLTHIHSFAYTANGNVITATCSNTDGKCPDTNGGTLTISAPAELYTDGTISREATVENNLVDTSVAVGEITYSTADGSAPKTAGTYTASVTIGGATASVEFTLSDYAAKVTDEDGNLISNYKTLADAVTAAEVNEESTLTLLDDITVAQEQDIKSGKFTLDLNGKNLVSESGRVIELFADVVLTIKDSGEGGTIEAKRGVAKAIINKGTLTVESGTVKGDGGIDNYGTLTFNNGTVEAGEYGAISNFNMAYVYDGVLRSSGSAAFNNYSTAYVYGGEISGVLNEGTAYISGGKIFRNNYAAFNLHAGTVEITGGSFSGTDWDSGYVSGTPYGEWTVCYTEGVNLILKGGEFPNGFVVDKITANEFLADGYHFRNEQGKVVDGSSRIIKEKVTVEKGADFSADAVVNVDNVVYNGAAQEPTVTVKVGGKTLTEGKDYTLVFANNVNAGTATVTVTSAGDYEGEIVKTFEIKKADSSIDVYPEANEITYNGEAQALVTAGSSENGAVVYSLDGAAYSETIPTGINAGKYTVYYKVIGDSNHNDSEPATVTVTIKAKDISDGFIILGDSLTYNGTEQTQTVAEFVIPEDLEVTYTVSGNKATNVGVYLLTVTGTGNFTGEAKITFEIAVDMNGLDFEKTYPSNVKSTDRERIEYVLNQIENAESDIANAEKRTEWIRIKGECVELLKMIKSVADKLKSFKTDLAKYDIDTVTSDDYDYLERFQNTIGDFEDFYFDNLTDEQVKETSDIFWVVVKLQNRISEVAKEITRITNAVNGYDEVTVKSTDKADLEQLKTDIKALAEGQNLTDEEREHLAELDAKLDAILKKIADTKAEIDRVNEAVNAYDEETIKSTDSADLEQLKEDIQALIDSGNVTENEKTALGEMLEKVNALLDKIAETKEKLEEIKGIESNYNPENVSSDDKAAIENKIAEIEAVNPDNLTNEQKAEYEEIKAGFEALLEEIEKAGSEVDAVGAELEMFDEERVTIFHEVEIEVLKAEIDELISDENMGEAEKAKLNEYKAQCDNLIEIINTPAKYFSMRLFHFVWDALHWLSSHVVFIFNWILAMF